MSISHIRDEIESKKRQLDERRANLRLIEEIIAQYVMRVEIPLQLIKEERALKEQIGQLETEIKQLEQLENDLKGQLQGFSLDDEVVYLVALQAWLRNQSTVLKMIEKNASATGRAYVDLSALPLSVIEVMAGKYGFDPISRRVNALDYIRKSRLIVVIGEPGCGKTMTALSLVGHVVNDGLRYVRSPRRKFWRRDSGPRIPFFVDLGAIHDNKLSEANDDSSDKSDDETWLLTQIVSQLINDRTHKLSDKLQFIGQSKDPRDTVGIRHYVEGIRRYYEEGRMVIVLDAFNEVAEDRYEELWDRINSIAKPAADKGNTLIITGRERQFKEQGSRWSNSNVEDKKLLRIVELDDDQIERLVATVEHALQQKTNSGMPSRSWADLREAMEKSRLSQWYVQDFLNNVVDLSHRHATSSPDLYISPLISRSIRNPLQLTLIYYIYYANKYSSTETRKCLSTIASLYEFALNYKVLRAEPVLREFLQKFAYVLMEEIDSGQTGTRASPETTDELIARAGGTQDFVTTAQDLGILSREANSTFGIKFTHQRFLEYFAACESYSHYGHNVLTLLNEQDQQFFDNPAWHETLMLTAGMFNDPNQVVKCALRHRSPLSNLDMKSSRLRLVCKLR